MPRIRPCDSLGFPEHPRESFRYFIGDGVETLIERVLPKDRCDAATLGECAALMRRRIRSAVGGDVAPL